MHKKEILHLTLVCDLDILHTNLDHLWYTWSCYGGHLCQVTCKSGKAGCETFAQEMNFHLTLVCDLEHINLGHICQGYMYKNKANFSSKKSGRK